MPPPSLHHGKVCSSRLNHRDTQSGTVTVAVLATQVGWLSSQVMRNTALTRHPGTLGGDTRSSAGRKVAWRGKGLACRGAGMTWLLFPVATSWSRSTSQSQTRAGDEIYRQCPNRQPRRGTLRCPQEGGQSHVPMAPAVPPMAVQHLRGLTWEGRGTSPAHPEAATGREPSSQDGQGSH